MTDTYRLYHYWRSSASWRVRWALELKKIKVEFVPIDLLTSDAESPEHLARNPLGYVPVLECLGVPEGQLGHYLTESTAIIEWLEETHPGSPLLPRKPADRAYVRAMAQVINSSLQPLVNPPVLDRYSQDKDARKKWIADWNLVHLPSFAKLAEKTAGKFCFGDTVTMADLFLIPQLYSARRFEVPVDREFPLLAHIYKNALGTSECLAASPESHQPKE